MPLDPSAVPDLASVETQLFSWSNEADLFRTAALAARANGLHPSAALASAAEAVQAGLADLLDDIDRALDHLPSGDAGFPAWLRTRVTALALLESIGNSLDVLDRYVPVTVAEPMRIEHLGLKTAAE